MPTKKRSSEILKYIITNDKAILPFKDLAAKYDISDKTLNRDLLEIDDFLKGMGIHPIMIDDKGNIINYSHAEKEDINNSMLVNFRTYYVMSSDERISFIMTILLNSKDYITMNDIASTLAVSRVTILNDMAEVERVIRIYHGKIDTRPGRGIRLKISEEDARLLIVDILKENFLHQTRNLKLQACFTTS